MDVVKILVLTGEYELNERVDSIIRSASLKSMITQANSLNEATPLFGAIGVLIVDFETLQEQREIDQLISNIIEHKDSMQVIIISSDTEQEKLKELSENLGYECLEKKPLNIIKFASKLSDILKAEEEDKPEFMAVRIPLFRKIITYPCDIFVSLSSMKFIKFANRGDKVELERISTLKKKGVTELYLTLDDFFNHSEEFFKGGLIHPEHAKGQDDFMTKSHEALHDMIQEIGISHHTVALAEETVDTVLKDFKDPKFKALLSKFKNDPDSFVYDHSYMTMVFCLEICKLMDWQSEANRKKLCLASMFHDFGFHTPKLAYFEHLAKGEILDLTKEQRAEILDHPQIMAEMLAEERDIPSDVIKLVSNHHEGAGDASYPKGLHASNLTQLECVFIAAHAFSLKLYGIGFNFQKIPLALDELAKTYSGQNFRKSIEALRSIVSN